MGTYLRDTTLAAFVGGVIAAYLVACLLGVGRSLFSSPASAAGFVILFGACRNSVASLYEQIAAHKAKTAVPPVRGGL
jgi:hypothetical protein